MTSNKKQTIWANTIVNNEENFIWFAIMSVIDYVDKLLVYDTGSEDKTVEIIKEIQKVKKYKIEFKQMGEVDKYQFSALRQEMLDQSNCDWILILDGDEIWWDDSIKKLVNTINKESDEIEGIVVPMKVTVGDIYHYQEEAAGQYSLLDKKGHYNLRAINRQIPNLHVNLPYGQEGYYDIDNLPIQERERIVFLKAPYFHTTHLRRSRQDSHGKFKYELGIKFPSKFQYPEVFYIKKPKVIPSPFKERSNWYEIRAAIETTIRKIKRARFSHSK